MTSKFPLQDQWPSGRWCCHEGQIKICWGICRHITQLSSWTPLGREWWWEVTQQCSSAVYPVSSMFLMLWRLGNGHGMSSCVDHETGLKHVERILSTRCCSRATSGLLQPHAASVHTCAVCPLLLCLVPFSYIIWVTFSCICLPQSEAAMIVMLLTLHSVGFNTKDIYIYHVCLV